MEKKIRNFISMALVVVFMTPMTVQLFDGLFHHHDEYFESDRNQETIVFEFHKKCPIPNFELSIFSTSKTIKTKVKNYFSTSYIENYTFNCLPHTINYSFLLRAPPVLSSLLS